MFLSLFVEVFGAHSGFGIDKVRDTYQFFEYRGGKNIHSSRYVDPFFPPHRSDLGPTHTS